jgi:hypothetical protein
LHLVCVSTKSEIFLCIRCFDLGLVFSQRPPARFSSLSCIQLFSTALRPGPARCSLQGARVAGLESPPESCRRHQGRLDFSSGFRSHFRPQALRPAPRVRAATVRSFVFLGFTPAAAAGRSFFPLTRCDSSSAPVRFSAALGSALRSSSTSVPRPERVLDSPRNRRRLEFPSHGSPMVAAVGSQVLGFSADRSSVSSFQLR